MLSYPSAAFRASAPRGTVLKLWDGKDIPSGLNVGAVNGRLSLSKASLGNQTAIFPDADIEVQGTHEVVQSSWTARNHGLYTAIASATVTDPSTPAAGHEFTTLVRNGTLTTSRGTYSVAGTLVQSVWHSGSWTDYPYGPLNGANTWTAAQTFSASARFNAAEAITCGMAATAGNGLLQLASGTTKANGIAFGTDTFLYRNGSNSLITDGALATKGDINILKSAGTDAQFLIQVSGTGSIQFGLNKSGSTNATGAADGEMYFGSNGAFPISITSGGTRRIRIGTGGELHLFGGTPVTRSTYGAPTGGAADRTTFDTTTVSLAQLAQRVRALIDDFRARGDFA